MRGRKKTRAGPAAGLLLVLFAAAGWWGGIRWELPVERCAGYLAGMAVGSAGVMLWDRLAGRRR